MGLCWRCPLGYIINDVTMVGQILRDHSVMSHRQTPYNEAVDFRGIGRSMPEPDRSYLQSTVDPNFFARPRWRHATRVFGALVVLMFNVTMIGANIDYFTKHGKTHGLKQEIGGYSLLLICDLLILLPIILEVDSARITDDKLILKTTFFKREIPWTTFTEFKRPPMLVYGILRTPRCFYLINRREMDRYDDLAQNIKARAHLFGQDA
jgi:hypothetical protein